MMESPSAASSTERHSTPTWSRLHARGVTPTVLIRPWVALQPTPPQWAAGRSTDPTVCVPRASGTMRAPTEDPEPLDEPPGVCPGFHGLPVAVGSGGAEGGGVTLPRITAPAG